MESFGCEMLLISWLSSTASSKRVKEVFENRPKFRFLEKGERAGEDVYVALGQSNAGRYLAVMFIHKKSKDALILSARTMAPKERRLYGKK